MQYIQKQSRNWRLESKKKQYIKLTHYLSKRKTCQ